jgi:hypothetical protein
MKIRLMGSPDLVRAWKAALEQSFGIHGAEYPSRRGGTDLRVYFDLDDRVAEQVIDRLNAARSTAVTRKPK